MLSISGHNQPFPRAFIKRRFMRRLRAVVKLALGSLLLERKERATSHIVWLFVVGIISFMLDGSHSLSIVQHTLALFSALLMISLFDACYFLIPDLLIILICAYGLALIDYSGFWSVVDHCAAGILGFLFVYCLELLYYALRGVAGIGRGDAKLLAAGGVWVGLEGLPTVVFWASISGLVTVAVLRLGRYEIRRTTAIPFGPHLAVAIWLVWLFGPVVVATGS